MSYTKGKHYLREQTCYTHTVQNNDKTLDVSCVYHFFVPCVPCPDLHPYPTHHAPCPCHLHVDVRDSGRSLSDDTCPWSGLRGKTGGEGKFIMKNTLINKIKVE